MGQFSSKISETTNPLRGLLSTKNKFQWLPSHTQAFRDTVKELTNPATRHHYDPTLETRLYTDASKLNGVGFILMQKHGNNNGSMWQETFNTC